MLFRHRKRDREILERLTQWAHRERTHSAELETIYGEEHVEEIGPLAWVFRAIESKPIELPTLGRWQKWERRLREQLALLPPPNLTLASFLAPLAILPAAQPAQIKAAVGGVIWKSSAIAAATSVITAHVVTSGALSDLDQMRPVTDAAAVTTGEVQPTGNPLLDHLRLTEAMLESNDPTVALNPNQAIAFDVPI